MTDPQKGIGMAWQDQQAAVVLALTRLLLLGLGLRCVVDQQGVQRQAVRKDEVPDVVAADAQRVHRNRLLVLQRHLDRLEVRVHGDINAGHRPLNHSACVGYRVRVASRDKRGEGSAQLAKRGALFLFSDILGLEQAGKTALHSHHGSVRRRCQSSRGWSMGGGSPGKDAVRIEDYCCWCGGGESATDWGGGGREVRGGEETDHS